ncbi:hypothetical protein ACOME3_003295 [Neoechinorhynchus agilis]
MLENDERTIEFVWSLINAGVSRLTVHGRTPEQSYRTPCNEQIFEKLYNIFPNFNLTINGVSNTVQRHQQLVEYMEKNKGLSVMIGRSARKNPAVFGSSDDGNKLIERFLRHAINLNLRASDVAYNLKHFKAFENEHTLAAGIGMGISILDICRKYDVNTPDYVPIDTRMSALIFSRDKDSVMSEEPEVVQLFVVYDRSLHLKTCNPKTVLIIIMANMLRNSFRLSSDFAFLSQIIQMSTDDVPNACPSSDPSAGLPGQAAACEGCPSRQQCASAQSNNDPAKLRRIKDTISAWQNRIMVMSGKGGVGKSTIATLLALGLSTDESHSVGIIDGDLCGPNIPQLLNATDNDVYQTSKGWSPVMVKENLAVVSSQYFIEPSDALIWRGPRKNGFLQQLVADVDWGELDYMVVDTPPGTSDEHITLAGLVKPTAVILVNERGFPKDDQQNSLYETS